MQNLKINKYKIIACVAAFVLIATFICTLCVSSVFETKIANGAVDFKTVGKSGFLVDVATGTVLYSRNEKERLPIASMVKIMTTLLTLEEVDGGRLALDDDVRISENAASMGGSQVFWTRAPRTKRVICSKPSSLRLQTTLVWRLPSISTEALRASLQE